jgi:uncharacterized protein
MRALVHALGLTIVAIGIGLAQPALADDPATSDRPITDILPLFAKNHCDQINAPADQIFCGDGKLSSIGDKLSRAIAERLGRLPNRRLAIEDNAEWIRDRNSSCGILGRQPIKVENIGSVRDCLLLESEERIAVLTDPNFDCLAVHTAAGALICSDPTLALAKEDLNEKAMALITKLSDDQARDASEEFERWTRERDRKCGLENKENVPLKELPSSEGCLSEYFDRKTAEVVAAGGDPKKLFGRQHASPQPNADAVDLCVSQIHLAGACGNFVAVNRVFQIDSKKSEDSAEVTSAIEMVVLAPFTACSPIASGCTGTCWDLKSGRPKAAPGSREQFRVGYRLRVEKSFAFQKKNDGWRCSSTTMQPVEIGFATSGP